MFYFNQISSLFNLGLFSFSFFFSLEEEQTVCTENLIVDLGQLLVADGGHYSDVELVCQGGEVIRCHKNILSARHGGVDHGIPTFPYSIVDMQIFSLLFCSD